MTPATHLQFLDLVLIAILALGIFLWGRHVTVPAMRKAIAAGSLDRIRFYLRGGSLLWGCTALLAVDWAVYHRATESLGLTAPMDEHFLIGALLTGSIMLGLLIGSVRLAKSGSGERQKQKLIEKSPLLYEMLPTDRGELAHFVWLSITAGVTEELLYRAFLIYAFTLYLPLAAAVVLSSVLFGLGHGYQGVTGMVKATILGAVLAVLYVGSGSLFLPMALHAFLDIQGGAVGLWLKSRKAGETPV